MSRVTHASTRSVCTQQVSRTVPSWPSTWDARQPTSSRLWAVLPAERRTLFSRRARSPSSTSTVPRIMTVGYSSAQPNVTGWANRDGCTGSPVQTYSMGSTTCVTYQTCRDAVEVEFCTVTGMGHCWPEDTRCGPGGGPQLRRHRLQGEPDDVGILSASFAAVTRRFSFQRNDCVDADRLSSPRRAPVNHFRVQLELPTEAQRSPQSRSHEATNAVV